MANEERHNLIEAYLSGKLTKAQEAIVERLQREDSSFQNEIEEQKELMEALGPSRINAFRRTAGEVIREQRPKKRKLLLQGYSIATAAIFVLLLIALWWFFAPAESIEEKLFSQYFSPPLTSAIFRNAGAGHPGEAAALFQRNIDSLYKRGEYEQALSHLSAYGAQFPEARQSDFYYWSGLLHLQAGQPEEALDAFSRIEAGYPYDKPWYSALAHLKAGHRQQARAAFSAIARPGGPYEKEASAILKALEAAE